MSKNQSCENCGNMHCANSVIAYWWDECVESNFEKHWMPKEDKGGVIPIPINVAYNIDCMEYMKTLPDKAFDLAIVDPPYGLERHKRGSLRIDNSKKAENGLLWDEKPSKEYFDELFRVSQKQIIWGANNFTLPETEYFIVWDKCQTVDNFASAEYAWTNIKMPAKVFRYTIHKEMADRKENGGKIHPTQKPVALYEWLLTNYAKPGDKILDTHLGSGSSRIAAYNLGFDFVGCEIDPDYFKAQEERFQKHTSQVRLFDLVPEPTEEQLQIF